MRRILIVDDDKNLRYSFSTLMRKEGYEVEEASDGPPAIRMVEEAHYDAIIMDIRMPRMSGLEAISLIHERHPRLPVIIATAYGTTETAIEAMRLGAYDYVLKPFDINELKLVIASAVEDSSLMRDLVHLPDEPPGDAGELRIIGSSAAMQEVYKLIGKVSRSDIATVLITGPTGCGKELVGRAIYTYSTRRDKPFQAVNCAALPDNLLESELFGHVKGSFTGAISNKEGKFLAADGGTIFLDEIDSATPSLQMKLLRVLQERQFEPVGSNETQTVDVRVILATNKNLQQEVKAGRFREDLYYRINVVNIDLPPLAERSTDIPLLAERFLNSMCQKHNKNKSGFADETIPYLLKYHWPGNVRELENVVERAVVLGRNSQIFPDDLPAHVIDYADQQTVTDYKLLSLREALEEPEKKILEKALRHNNWNRQATAEMLQINRTTLYKKLKRFNLDAEQLSRTTRA